MTEGDGAQQQDRVTREELKHVLIAVGFGTVMWWGGSVFSGQTGAFANNMAVLYPMFGTVLPIVYVATRLGEP